MDYSGWFTFDSKNLDSFVLGMSSGDLLRNEKKIICSEII